MRRGIEYGPGKCGLPLAQGWQKHNATNSTRTLVILQKHKQQWVKGSSLRGTNDFRRSGALSSSIARSRAPAQRAAQSIKHAADALLCVYPPATLLRRDSAPAHTVGPVACGDAFPTGHWPRAINATLNKPCDLSLPPAMVILALGIG